MKEENFSSSVGSGTASDEPNSSQLAGDNVQRRWQEVVKRRSFLKGISLAGATLTAGALMGKNLSALTTSSSRRVSKGDAALLRSAAAVELIEADLWQQYNELGGVQGGNPAYIAALSNLDGDMPQYIADNTDDELSHAAFLNAYLTSRGAEPVDLDAFRTLPSSQATGAKNTGRLTNLLKLNVDLSWYTRYRSKNNPDLGAHFEDHSRSRTNPRFRSVTLTHRPILSFQVLRLRRLARALQATRLACRQSQTQSAFTSHLSSKAARVSIPRWLLKRTTLRS